MRHRKVVQKRCRWVIVILRGIDRRNKNAVDLQTVVQHGSSHAIVKIVSAQYKHKQHDSGLFSHKVMLKKAGFMSRIKKRKNIAARRLMFIATTLRTIEVLAVSSRFVSNKPRAKFTLCNTESALYFATIKISFQIFDVTALRLFVVP